MARQDPVEQMMYRMQLDVPGELRERMEQALSPHIELLHHILSECSAFVEHYKHLLDTDQLHPETAIQLLRHLDLLRFNLIEPIALLESFLVLAEYVAHHASEERTVEMRRKQAEVWTQPFRRMERVLKEYAQWLENVSFTLRMICRRGE